MFDNLQLLSTSSPDIVLHTRTRRPIPNEIGCAPTEQHIRRFQALLKQGQPLGWEVRKPPTGGYNCAGHVWASRRTGIYEDLEQNVKYILQDDGYRLIGRENAYTLVLQGDLVLYWDSFQQGRLFLHVGMVSEMRDGVTRESPRLPWVLSKWDDVSGEVLHHFKNVPFPAGDFVVEFWTDRPITVGKLP